MKTTVTEHDFIQAFNDIGRADQFSREGLAVLFEYLEQYEEETGEEIELDVVALCCDFYEGSYSDIARDYSIDIDSMDEDEIADAVREYLEDEGVLVGEVTGGFVYRAH